MAARETQVLHIALIIFVALTVILFVLSFFIFRSYQEEQARLTEVKDKFTKSEAALRTAIQEGETLKGWIGSGATDTVDAVSQTFKKDMQKYGSNFPEAQQNYRKVIEYVHGEMVNANARVAEAAVQHQNLKNELEQVKAEKDAELAKVNEQLKKSDTDLAEERAKFNRDRAKITKDDANIQRQLKDKDKEAEDLAKRKDADIHKLQGQLNRMATTNEGLRIRNREDIESAEIADGKVTGVDQRSHTVWINVGSDDGLRRQMSFSVLGQDETNPAKAPKKGKLEVTRIIDRHMAEARIVEDTLSNPIMPGDQIFSPVFQPGQREHFALAGFIDFDGDGISDLARVKELIELNGGVVDAENTEDGAKKGFVTVHTRYLVVGEEPTEKSKAGVEGFTAIKNEAQSAGVASMSLRDFMNYLGYKVESRSVELGSNVTSSAKQRAAAAASTEKAEFKPRVPKTRKVTY